MRSTVLCTVPIVIILMAMMINQKACSMWATEIGDEQKTATERTNEWERWIKEHKQNHKSKTSTMNYNQKKCMMEKLFLPSLIFIFDFGYSLRLVNFSFSSSSSPSFSFQWVVFLCCLLVLNYKKIFVGHGIENFCAEH